MKYKIVIALILFSLSLFSCDLDSGMNSLLQSDTKQLDPKRYNPFFDKVLPHSSIPLKGYVATFAGTGSAGFLNDTGTAASFNKPGGITTDGTNIYVADTYNNRIRKIVISTGEVSTLAGSGEEGSTDGIGTAASFKYPIGITTDGKNLYVADTSNNLIRKIVISTAEVTTLAGSGRPERREGFGSAASFHGPQGITTDGTNLYVADTTNHLIRKIVISTAEVSSLAGTLWFTGSYSKDGIGTGTHDSDTCASFYYPLRITTDGINLYVTELVNHLIRKVVISTREVTTLAGTGRFGFENGTGKKASFSTPSGIATDGINLYIADTNNHVIRKIVISTGEVTTLVGSGEEGSVNETGTASSFNKPEGITTDGTSLYVADTLNHLVRKID